jgi:hypothetical protein
VSWEEEAVGYVVKETRSYPYFLQEYGEATWNATGGTTLTYNDARVGAMSGQAHLDTGFYRARWERAAPAQRAYLEAMAQDGEGPASPARSPPVSERPPPESSQSETASSRKALSSPPNTDKSPPTNRIDRRRRYQWSGSAPEPI